MDSIGDLLYVLFVVIALVLSVVKKKKEQHHVPPFIPDDEDEEVQDHPVREIFQQKESNPVSPPVSFKSNPVIHQMPVAKRPATTTTATKLHSKIVVEEEVESILEIEDMDWKKVVIYSEIMKRPQY